MKLRQTLSLVLSLAIAVNPALAATSNIIRLGAPVSMPPPPTENWVAAEPEYSDWETGAPYGCSTWTPSPAGYSESTQFVQTADDCEADASRTRQEREFDTISESYRNVGEPVTEEVTYVNQTASRDYRIAYTNWQNVGDFYGCTNWTPAPEGYPIGTSFTQTATDCSIDQTQTRAEHSRLEGFNWVSEASLSYDRTLANQTSQRQAEGIADLPTIALNAPNTAVFAGESFILNWSAHNAVNVTLKGDVADSGLATSDFTVTGSTHEVTPAAPGTYRYTATATNSANQSITAHKDVIAVSSPTISTFTADRASVATGGTVTFNWVANGFDSLEIDNGVGQVTGNTTSISADGIAGVHTYTLTATKTLNGVEKTDSKTVDIEVVADPSLSITSAPTTVFANAPFTLKWAGEDVVSYSIKGSAATSGLSTAGVNLAEATSTSITPTAAGTYTYTLTGTNSVGETKSITQTVAVVANPAITSFTSNASVITAEGSILLSWATTGSGSLSINQAVGAVTGTSKTVMVGSSVGTRTYTLTSTRTLNGVTRTATQSVTVEVVSAPSVSITTAPATNVFADAAFTLGWTGTGATNYKIRGNVAASGVSTTDIDLGIATSRAITPTAAGSYTYTVTATNAAGVSTTTTRTVTVVADPVISAFTASPTTVTVGGNTTLSWTTTGTSLSIDQSVGVVTGTSATVAVGTTIGSKTYTLTASSTLNGVTRSAIRSVAVSVVAAPTVSITTAPATNVFANAAFTLGWTGTGATNYKIRGNVVASGVSTTDIDLGTATSRAITPTAAGSYTYTVTATNAAGVSTTTTRTVTVVADPVVSAFTASPSTVTVGGSTTLSWATTGTSLSIDQSVGAVTGTSTSVAVGATVGSKTYTLTASATLNGVTRSATRSVAVSVVAAPTVSITTAPATSVFANAAFTLGWAGTGATNYKIRGNVAASGVGTTDLELGTSTSRAITPTAAGSYTYTVTATNAAGVSTTTTRTVTVVADPVVSSFTASPTTVTVGGSTTLSWTTTGTSLSIDQSVGSVTGTSTSVAVGTTAGSKTYTLTASSTLNGVTRSATRSLAVSVVAAPTVSITTAPATNVFANAAFNMGWTGTGGTNYKIRGNVAASGVGTTDLDLGTSTSRAITPTAAGSYTYTVTATNAAGVTMTASKTVTVVADPVVSTLTASPTTVTVGGSTTLTWATTGTALSINQSVGAVSGTSKSVAVGATAGSKTYTLTASSTLNGVTRSATRNVTVSVVAAPTVSISTAPSTNVFVNTAFTLGWTGTGATSYAIKGSASASGVATSNVAKGTATSHSITPTAVGTYTYTVTATNAAGTSATTTRSVTVVALPTLTAFSASPTSVTAGGNTTLSWAGSGYSSLSINQSVGTVTGSSKLVAVGSTVGTKTYTLTASTTLNGVTKTATRTASVNVTAGYLYDSSNYFECNMMGVFQGVPGFEYGVKWAGTYYGGGALIPGCYGTGNTVKLGSYNYLIGALREQTSTKTKYEVKRL